MNSIIRPTVSFALAAILFGTMILWLPPVLVADQHSSTSPRQAEASGPDDFTFTAVGDWGCTPSTASMTSKMSMSNPEIVLGLGDYSYTTTMACWHNILISNPTVHNAIHMNNSVAFGNHELTTCGNSCLNSTGQAEYLSHFHQPPTYFSFDHKRVHFIALNTNISDNATSPQYSFISADLSQAKQRKDNGFIDWIVVFMHHPLYTSSCLDGVNPCDSSHGNNTAIRNLYQPLFDQYGVDIVLQAHVHAYERMKPLKSGAIITHPDIFDYVNPAGQIYLTVGTGGESHYHYSSHPQMSVVQVQDIFGFLQANVTRTTFVGQFIDTNGVVWDSFIIIKTREPLPSPLLTQPPPSTGPSPNPPSYFFTGSNYTERVDDNTLRLTQFSVATWFKLGRDYSSASTKSPIVNKGGFGSESSGQNMNYGIWVDFGSKGNRIQAGFENSNGTDRFVESTQAYSDGQWHYAVVTYDKLKIRLFIDAVQVASSGTTTSPDNGTQPLRIGANSLKTPSNSYSWQYFTGYADEIRVWNRALSSSEVSNAYNSNTFNTNGQVAYFTP